MPLKHTRAQTKCTLIHKRAAGALVSFGGEERSDVQSLQRGFTALNSLPAPSEVMLSCAPSQSSVPSVASDWDEGVEKADNDAPACQQQQQPAASDAPYSSDQSQNETSTSAAFPLRVTKEDGRPPVFRQWTRQWSGLGSGATDFDLQEHVSVLCVSIYVRVVFGCHDYLSLLVNIQMQTFFKCLAHTLTLSLVHATPLQYLHSGVNLSSILQAKELAVSGDMPLCHSSCEESSR